MADLDLVVTDTEMEALALENNIIKRHRPRYNVLLRDDKNHPYLKLTLSEEYPRLYVVRRVGEDRDAYGGPYIPAKLGRRTAGVVHKVFGIRSCKEVLNGRRPRPCLQYQIDRCLAPCVAEVCSPERYRQAAEDAALFLEGRTDEVVRRLRDEMSEAAEEHRFEEAASLRDQVRALERLDAPQKITTTDLDERDVFGAHHEGARAALQVFTVRDGRVVAREGFLLDVPEPERFLASAIQQYYDGGRDVPREVLVPAAIVDQALLEEWLGRKRGGAGAHPRAAARREDAAAGAGAAQRAPGLRPGVAPPAPAVAGDPARAARPAGAGGGAAPHRVLRHLEHPGLRRGGLDGGVRGRPAAQVGLPQVPHPRPGRRARRLRVHARGGGPALPPAAGGGQGAARPGPHRRRQGPARRRHRRAGGAGPRPPARGLAGQARGADLRCPGARSRWPCPAARRCCSSCSACATRRTASPSASTARSRAKRTLTSELDDIPGVGPAKRRKLLSRFGSVRGVRGASVEELASAVGTGMAARIRAWFQKG